MAAAPAHGAVQVTHDDEQINIATGHYQIEIAREGFRYALLDSEGNVIAQPHAESGLQITPAGEDPVDAESVSLVDWDQDQVQLEVQLRGGGQSDVLIHPYETYARFQIHPKLDTFELDHAYSTSTSARAMSLLELPPQPRVHNITARIHVDNRTDSSASGLIFRYQDPSNFYHLRVHSKGRLQLLKWHDGTPPWALEHDEYERIVKNAVDWHNQHIPYIYSAVLDWYHTGYPHAMTPLHIAYPHDTKTHELINMQTRQYQWMLGPSLLAAPVFGRDFETADARDVYLPEGRWMDYETGEIFQGPVTLEDYSLPVDKMPLFVGAKATLVTGDIHGNDLHATAFPVADPGTTYRYNHLDAQTTSTITILDDAWDHANVVVKNTTQQERIPFEVSPRTRAVRFALTPGDDYQVFRD